jgi:signal transduction histidine kinase
MASHPEELRHSDEADVTGSLWRALAVLRFVTLAHAVIIDTRNWQDFARPLTGWMVLSGVAVWTLIVTWAYDSPNRRRWWVLSLDFVIAVGALVVTPYVETLDLRNTQATVASYWVIAPVLAWAIHKGWLAGALAAVLLEIPDVWIRSEIDATVLGNSFLLLMAGAVVGYLATLLRDTAAERAYLAGLAARTAERERLARAVHDGVLQVLSYVQRRGPELGPAGNELAQAAGEQEEKLRALVQGKPLQAEGERETDPGGLVNVGRSLSELANSAGSSVSIAAPAGPVLLGSSAAQELVAAVRAALDNAAQHAPGAKVYLLLEDEGSAVVVSIRDTGPGIADGRLREAAASGRMGVSRSIRGRMADLGGTATLNTAEGAGTEWELRLPRGES